MEFENLYSDQAKEPRLRMNNLQTHEQVSFSADKNYSVPNAVYGEYMESIHELLDETEKNYEECEEGEEKIWTEEYLREMQKS